MYHVWTDDERAKIEAWIADFDAEVAFMRSLTALWPSVTVKSEFTATKQPAAK